MLPGFSDYLIACSDPAFVDAGGHSRSRTREPGIPWARWRQGRTRAHRRHTSRTLPTRSPPGAPNLCRPGPQEAESVSKRLFAKYLCGGSEHCFQIPDSRERRSWGALVGSAASPTSLSPQRRKKPGDPSIAAPPWFSSSGAMQVGHGVSVEISARRAQRPNAQPTQLDGTARIGPATAVPGATSPAHQQMATRAPRTAPARRQQRKEGQR